MDRGSTQLYGLYRSKQEQAIVKSIDENKNSPRVLWQTLNMTLGMPMKKLLYEHSAKEFSDFFHKKVADIRSATAAATPPVFTTVATESFVEFLPVTESNLCSIINRAPSKQSELDPVPTWFLKKSLPYVAPFLTDLVNASLLTASVPACMKNAIVTPILKKDNLDVTVIGNYRPVSNLSYISKLIERVVCQQVTHFLESNSLLPDYQSAYRADHSTETALLRLYSDLVEAADDGKVSILALLDLSAAFDTVDHEILLNRLSCEFGLYGNVLQWLRSYLTDRQQSVRCSGKVSAPRTLLCGVPQGSVLGPLLFLMYTAGLQHIICNNGFSGYFYADDSQLRASDYPCNSSAMRNKVEKCVESVEQWMGINRLKLNPAKTELMWCGTRHQCGMIDTTPFNLGGVSISPVTTVRLLGVQIDGDLSMSGHVNSTIRSCFYQIRRLKAARRSLTIGTTKTVVTSLVLSRIDYCNGVLAGITQRQCDRLQAVLNTAAKMIYGGTRRDHVTPILRDKLHWLRFRQRISYKLCLLVYKSLHERASCYIKDLVVPVANVSATRRLRSASAFMVRKPAHRKQLGERGFAVAGPAAWNSLPYDVKSCQSLEMFKSKLKLIYSPYPIISSLDSRC